MPISLTKPLGLGVLNNRHKTTGEVFPQAVATMVELNRAACEAALAAGVVAATDVTGFGLLGHLLEMMTGSKTRARIFFAQVPVLDGIRELAEQDVIPGGSKANLDYVQGKVRFADELPLALRLVLADAQTNGGLLASVPSKESAVAMRALARAGVTAAVIGDVKRGSGIEVLK